ncbi:MAG: undecaprenyl-diphosphatase UppP [Verrucomicrobiae bacterium]|nr:undecaprenyl-diphosphatase UppP [Verrucomicrobiae bacterium]
MKLWEAIFLGLVQGLTEFLPISSTAHLRIVPAVFGWGDPGAAFTAVTQLGTFAAVLVYFGRDLASLIRDAIRGRGRMIWMICVATVPIVLTGVLFKNYIEHQWRSLYVVSTAMIGLALVMAAAELWQRRHQKLRGLEDMGWLDAVVVGLWQALALVPGSSRSGCTIAGGLFLGFKREAAARFAFLLSLPSVFAAGVLEMRELYLANGIGWGNTIAAAVTAFVSGYGAIAFLLRYLRQHTLWLFIFYRLWLGTLLLAGLSTGKLQPL